MIDPKDFKCRASALSNIISLNDWQLSEVEEKDLNSLSIKKERYALDDKVLGKIDQSRLDKVIKKRDTEPTLSSGGKTYLKDWFFGQKFDFYKTTTSKQTQKGNALEDRAIKEVVKYLGIPSVFKNSKRFHNDWIHGEPDVNLSVLNFQFDTKVCYYPNALNSFEQETESSYIWQQKGYNWLLEVDHGFVAKVLLNPTEELLRREINTYWQDAGNSWTPIDDIPESFKNEVRELFNFEKKPIEERINLFHIQQSDNDIAKIKKAVELCREELEDMNIQFSKNNSKEVKLIKNLLKIAS